MHYFVKTLLFVASVLLVFSYIAYSIPSQPSLPPEEGTIDFASIETKGDLVSMGQKIFFGKGKCALCHTVGEEGGRCPNLAGVGAKLTREFIYESLVHPESFVYKQYQYNPPKSFPAQMPPINKPPIGLSENELLAVIAFVQSTGGQEYVTVEPSELVMPAKSMVAVSGDPAQGKTVFQKIGCAECHEENVEGSKTGVASLLKKAQHADPLYLMRVLENGSSPEHQGFSSRVSVKELNDITAYLAQFKAAESESM